MMILTMTLIAFANSLISSSFILFVMPKRKKGAWNLSVIPIVFALSFLFLMAYYKEYMMVVSLLEYIIMITPVAVYCSGDIWRNLLIRLIYQLGVNAVTYIRTPLKLFADEEKEFQMTRCSDSLGFGIYYNLILVLCLTVLILIFRPIVKRWGPEHKKVYTVVTAFIIGMGLINGLYKVGLLTKDNYKDAGLADKIMDFTMRITFLIIMATVFVGNLMYNRYVNGLIKKENSEIKEKIHDRKKSLSGPGSLKDFMDNRLLQLEKEGMSVNCIIIGNIESTPKMRSLMDTLIDEEKARKAENVEIRIVDKNEMIMIMLSDDGKESVNDPDRENTLERLIQECCGTKIYDEGLSILLPKNEIL
ncbi:MAG: hypothetical protein J6M24_05950 [Lachnospiraceae bacterium]|nr:hypothetical protein [Lachnospiraceae bacterium]